MNYTRTNQLRTITWKSETRSFGLHIKHVHKYTGVYTPLPNIYILILGHLFECP